MKHKHHDMIAAKAANMELVKFVKDAEGKWYIGNKEYVFYEDREYFLCLPQFEKECLHWLNGGKVETIMCNEWRWFVCDNYSDDAKWVNDKFMMNPKHRYRIKLTKVKKWIGVDKIEGKLRTTTYLYNSIEELKAVAPHLDYSNWQFIEVEVEE